jgi:hypothetical protein
VIPIRPAAAAILAAVFFLAACGRADGEGGPPKALAGLERHHEVSGSRATRAFRRLPGVGDAEVRSAWIAGYVGEDQRAMVYAGRARDVADAQKLLRSLRAGLLDGKAGYRELSPLREREHEVHRLSGQGDRHFLFRVADRVIWTSADSTVAGRVLRDLVDHLD